MNVGNPFAIGESAVACVARVWQLQQMLLCSDEKVSCFAVRFLPFWQGAPQTFTSAAQLLLLLLLMLLLPRRLLHSTFR